MSPSPEAPSTVGTRSLQLRKALYISLLCHRSVKFATSLEAPTSAAESYI